MTPEEIEADRLNMLEEAVAEDWGNPKNFLPGTFGGHELIDRSSLIQNMWTDYIKNHMSCLLNSELYALADEIEDKLIQFYSKASNLDISSK